MSRSDFQTSYELSPIVMTGGSSSDVPGGMTPVVSVTDSGNFPDGLSGAASQGGPDDYFAKFVVLPGGTLIDNAVGEYPFANQAVAANAIITQPLAVSLLMLCPVRDGGWAAKQATMTSLVAAMKAHVNAGGTFTVATPAFIYTDMLLLKLVDVSDGETKQVQVAWQWNFYKPLLTLADADEAENNLMRKLSGGTPVAGDPPSWSGSPPTVGNPPSLAGASAVPAASGLAGSSVAGITPPGLVRPSGL